MDAFSSSSSSNILEENIFPCPKCGKIYQYKNSRKNHIMYECGKEPNFKCPYCVYKCKQAGNLRRHIILRHSADGVIDNIIKLS